MLDQFDPQHLRPLFRACFQRLIEAGVISEYCYWPQHVPVSIDEVEHFSSTMIHCPSCLTRRRSYGEMSNHHAGPAAVLIDPDRHEVFPLDFEPILREYGEEKNYCERNAAERLCKALRERYGGLPIILVEDALYANAPHLCQITGYGCPHVINEAGLPVEGV